MSDDATTPRIRVTADGPLEVTGGVPLVRCEIVTNDDDESIGWEETAEIDVGEEYLLCRCGQSSDKPFCDFSHVASGFDGTETASRTVFNEEAACYDGPYNVTGSIRLVDADGNEFALEEGRPVALCRCGHSCNKPFCDGSHVAEKFVDEGAR